MNIDKATVYRFHDYVAMSVFPNTGGVAYLSPEQARQFANALLEFATDVKAVPFAESQLTEVTTAVNERPTS